MDKDVPILVTVVDRDIQGLWLKIRNAYTGGYSMFRMTEGQTQWLKECTTPLAEVTR